MRALNGRQNSFYSLLKEEKWNICCNITLLVYVWQNLGPKQECGRDCSIWCCVQTKSPFKKLKAKLRPSLWASVFLCTFVLFVSPTVFFGSSDREADLTRMDFNWLLKHQYISPCYPEACVCSVSTVWTNVKNKNNSPLFLLSHIISPAIWLKIELYANVFAAELSRDCHSKILQHLSPKLFLVAAQWKSRAMLRWDNCVAPVNICSLFACTQLGSQGCWMIHRYLERGQKLLY